MLELKISENLNYKFDNVGEMELMKELPELENKLIDKGDCYLLSDHSCEICLIIFLLFINIIHLKLLNNFIKNSRLLEFFY